jgi:hypothetical protein
MRSFFSVIAVVASTIICSFSILAANDEPIAAESPSEESSSKSGGKPDVTPDAEGFYGSQTPSSMIPMAT